MRRIVLLDQDYFAVSFPYNAATVERIKRLSNRRWNPDAKHWEIHLSHLPEVMAIFRMNQTMVPPDVNKAFAEKWQGADAVLRIFNDKSLLSGGNLPIEAIDQATSYWKIGAEHTNKYKQGKWDGMRRLFDKRNHEFPTGLLDRVTEILDRQKVRYKIDDQRVKNDAKLRFRKPAASGLRAYQKAVLKEALESERGILEMATGSGKTVVAAHIIASLKRPTLFFVHTKDLLYQTKNLLGDILNIPIGQIGDGVVDIQPITVGTIQTCSRCLGITVSSASEADEEMDVSSEESDTIQEDRTEQVREALRNAGVAIFDECHHVPADTCYSLTMNLPNAFYRFGLSATPYRADRQDLLIEAAIGKKFSRINASYLVKKKFLVPPHITFFLMPATQPTAGRTYHNVYQHEIVKNETRNKFIAEISRKFIEQGKTVLVLVSQVRHGENVLNLLPEAVFLTGKDTSNVRNTALDGLRERRIPAIIATTLADEGLDIPSLDVLVLAGGGKSETRALQRIGRALRPVKGKKIAFVVDFFDQARFLCEHSKSRLEIYKTEDCFKIEMTNPWTEKTLSESEIGGLLGAIGKKKVTSPKLWSKKDS